MRVKEILAYFYLLGCLLHPLIKAITVSEFKLDGDYLIGGLFDIHHVGGAYHHYKPETVTCSRYVL